MSEELLIARSGRILQNSTLIVRLSALELVTLQENASILTTKYDRGHLVQPP